MIRSREKAGKESKNTGKGKSMQGPVKNRRENVLPLGGRIEASVTT